MTREEAKKIINRNPFWTFESIPDEMREAVDCLMEEQEPCEDAISRQAVLDVTKRELFMGDAISEIEKLPSVTPKQKMSENPTGSNSSEKPNKWIPVSERLPEDTNPVNITWVNHDPESYYADIKDKPFTATGHYCNGRWWWYSVTCQDYLDEYGRSDVDSMDEAIEVVAWMPLPEPYKAESEDKE